MITVRYFAAAKDAVGVAVEGVEFTVEFAGTVAGVRAALLAKHPQLATVLKQSRLAVNQKFAKDEDDVPDGAEVAVIPPVGGG